MERPFLEKEVHDEFAKRMEEEHARQNQRIKALEDSFKETRSLALSIERLTMSVKSMVEVQKSQGERLDVIENRDGEMWRKVVGYVISSIVGIVVGYIFTRIGM